MGIKEKKSRNISFDLLRIISAFSVVMLHVSAEYIHSNPVGSLDFQLANFMNSISRFGVPIFVMISGRGLHRYILIPLLRGIKIRYGTEHIR